MSPNRFNKLINKYIRKKRVEAEQPSGWLKTKREALAQDGILKEVCVNPTRKDYQTSTSPGRQESADLCPMPMAAELVFTRKALLLEITISPLFSPPDAEERAWARASGITVFPVIGKRKQSSIFKITFNYRLSISTFKNMQIIWVMDINELF